jgi:hypothetical protein
MVEKGRSGREFVDFWSEYAAKRGLMGRSTAETMKSACKVVMSTVEPDTWEELDISTIDLDSFVDRFQRLKMTDLKPDSLHIYGKRFRNAIASYQEYLASPTTWKYGSTETRSTPSNGEGGKRRAPKPKVKAMTNINTSQNGVGTSEVPTISYPYPLRPGLLISVELPADLTKLEATRLASFLQSLAVDPQPALPRGGGNSPRENLEETT